MGFIKIIRWRVGGALDKMAPAPQAPVEVGALQRAAIFAICLGREHASLLFKEFTQREARVLSQEMNRFQEVERSLALDVLQEFLDGITIQNLPDYVPKNDAQEVARALVRGSAAQCVERMRSLWLEEPEEESFEEESVLELDFSELEPAQKAAVFMMWLPPELSAMVLKKFPPHIVHVVTSMVVELPFVPPKARELVLKEFMEGVSLGIPGLSLGDVGLPVVVEAFVRSDPEDVAKRLEEKWLPQAAVLVPGANQEPAAPEMTPVEKVGVFFQSLSLPLAHRLLKQMEESEIELVMETIDQMGIVDSETRKRVLRELMAVSRQDPADEKSQPIHLLGKAMGSMIRKRPEVVVNQIRKAWLKSEQ